MVAGVSLGTVVSEKFLTSLSSVAKSSSSSTTPSGKSSGDASIVTGLRFGAKLYGAELKSLNALSSIITLADSALEELSTLADKALTVAKRATASNVPAEKRSELDRQFQKLGTQFKEVIEISTIEGTNYLDVSQFRELFSRFGLAGDSIEKLFADASTVSPDDDALASTASQGKGIAAIPASAYTGSAGEHVTATVVNTGDSESIFTDDRTLKKRPDAYSLVSDLQALKKQITKNRDFVEQSKAVVADHAKLLRTTGLSMLEVADVISDSDGAAQVADKLQNSIRRSAGSSLDYIGSLERLTEAALQLVSGNSPFATKR